MKLRVHIKKVIARKPRWLGWFRSVLAAAPAPYFVLIHVNLDCRIGCKLCYQGEDHFFRHVGTQMRVDDFERILVQCKKLLWTPHIHLFGGEPLLHPQAADILALCRTYAVRPTLTTSGARIESYVNELAGAGIDQINYSISSVPGPERQILRLKKILPQLGPTTRLNLNYALFPGTESEILKTVETCASEFDSRSIGAFVIQHLQWEYQNDRLATPPHVANLDVNTIVSQLREIESRTFGFPVWCQPHIPLKDVAGYYHDPDYRFRYHDCFVPWLGLAVYPDLTVGPGGAIFSCAQSLGRLDENTIKQIWKGAALGRFQREVRQGLPLRCSRCCQRQYAH